MPVLPKKSGSHKAVSGPQDILHAVERALEERKSHTQRNFPHFAAILDNATDAVIAEELDGKVTAWNRGAEKMYGYSADEMIGQSILRIIPEDRRKDFEIFMGRIKAGESVERYETVRTRKDGTSIDISISLTPIRNASGKSIGAALIAHDISERKQAERERERSEKNFTDFFENGAIALHWVGPDGTILRANKAELRMMGYEADEYVGRNITDFHADADAIADILRRLSAGEVLHDYPARMKCKDGSIRHVLIDSSVLWENGKFIHTRCFTRDVTEQMTMHEKLRRSTRQLQFVLQNVDDGVTMQDPKTGNLLYANEIAAQLCGFSSAEEFLAVPVTEVVRRFEMMDEEGNPLPVSELPGRKAMKGEISEAKVVRFRIKETGEERWSNVQSKPVFDDAGNVTSVLNIFHDVTDQKRNEHEAAFLAKATSVLGSSIDYHTVLQNVASLVVPHLADWCTVALVEEDGTLHSVATAHKDPQKIEWAKSVVARYPTDYNAPHGAGRVIRSGESQLYESISEEMIRGASQSEEHYELLSKVGFHSVMIVPIIARNKPIGALSFVFSESHRCFTNENLAFAEDFGRRIGMAIDNARLYRAAQREIEDRKLAEDALRLSEARYERAAQAGSTGIWDWNMRTNELFLAPNLKALLGYENDEVQNTVDAWTALIHPEDRERMQDIFDLHLQGKSPMFEAEMRRLHKNGEYRWFLARGTAVRDSTGRPFRMTGTDTDITERKIAEEGLKHSEDRYRAFIRQSSEGIWRFELEQPVDVSMSEDDQIEAFFTHAYLAECNDALAKMYGFDSASDVTGARLGDMLIKDDPKNIEYLRAFIRSGYNLLDAQSHETDKDGDEKYFMNNLVGTVEDDRLIRAWGMQRDVTQRKKTEDALRESEIRFRNMADSAPVLIWMSGQRKEGVFFNKTWLDFTGHTLQEEMGDRWLQSIHPEDAGALQACADAFENHTSFTTQFRMRRADGAYRWILDTGVPRFGTDGSFAGFIGSCIDITEQKEAEDLLRSGQERYRSLVTATAQIVWIASPEGKVSEDLPGWRAFTGQNKQEILGLGWTDALHPDDRERVNAVWKHSLATGTPHEQEFRVRRHDGSYRHMLGRAVPVKEETGIVREWVGTCTDITEQKRAEEELARDAMLLANVRDSIVVTDMNYIITHWNEGATRLFGWSKKEMIGRSLLDRFPVAERARMSGIMENILAGKEFLGEWQDYRKDGSRIWIEARVRALKDDAGVPIGIIGLSHDIQDRKAVEEEIRLLNEDLEKRVTERTRELHEANTKLTMEIAERERAEEHDRANLERLRSIIDSMPLGAIMADEKQVIIHANEHFCRLFNMDCPPSALVHKTGVEVIMRAVRSVTHPKEYAERVSNTLKLKQPDLNQEVLMKDGRVLSRDYLPITVQGAHRGHLLLYRDITQERRVDAAKSEFMSLASHQLRTPLTAIRWSFGRLGKTLKGKTSELEDRVLREGHREAVRMAETIDTMLAISRIEAGKVRLMQSEVSLSALLDEARLRFQDQYRRKEQIFEVRCEPDVSICTDPNLLKEILHNMVSNSIKYTPANGSITISAKQERGEVLIEVADTGYGIPAHQQHQIFNKFFRGENILDKDTAGTGLGLYLVSLLVTLLGGSISFESVEGEGSTFRLLFPSPSSTSHA